MQGNLVGFVFPLSRAGLAHEYEVCTQHVTIFVGPRKQERNVLLIRSWLWFMMPAFGRPVCLRLLTLIRDIIGCGFTSFLPGWF